MSVNISSLGRARFEPCSCFCSTQARGGDEAGDVIVDLAHQRRKGVGVEEYGTTRSFSPMATRVENFQGPEESGVKEPRNRYWCYTGIEQASCLFGSFPFTFAFASLLQSSWKLDLLWGNKNVLAGRKVRRRND